MDPATYASVMAHPFVVTLSNAEWIVENIIGFQSESEAVAFARSRPEPVIYVNDRRDHTRMVRIVGYRILAPHPNPVEGYTTILRDDFPQEARFVVESLINGEGFVVVDKTYANPMIGPYAKRKWAQERAAEFEAGPTRVPVDPRKEWPVDHEYKDG